MSQVILIGPVSMEQEEIDQLALLPKLQYLQVHNLSINSLEKIATLPNLSFITLKNVGITEAQLLPFKNKSSLTKLQNLEEVILDNNAIIDVIPLAQLLKLHQVSINTKGILDIYQLNNISMVIAQNQITHVLVQAPYPTDSISIDSLVKDFSRNLVVPFEISKNGKYVDEKLVFSNITSGDRLAMTFGVDTAAQPILSDEEIEIFDSNTLYDSTKYIEEAESQSSTTFSGTVIYSFIGKGLPEENTPSLPSAGNNNYAVSIGGVLIVISIIILIIRKQVKTK